MTSSANTMSASPPGEGSSAAQKRRSDEAAPQPRAKRNRYISIACNECKRRKIKCNGQTPCQRCGNLSLECLYAPNCCNNFKDSDEFKQMSGQISLLQEQVEQLFANLSALKAQVDIHSASSMPTPFNPPDFSHLPNISPSPSRQRSKSSATRPRFQGPASNAFNLGVAKSSLQTMGITEHGEVEDEGIITMDATLMDSPPLANTMLPKVLHVDKDPIWHVSKQEAMGLLRFWQEEMGAMYPFLDIDQMTRYAELLFTFMEAAARQGFVQSQLPGADAFEDEKTSILKLMLAAALVLRGNGKDTLGDRFFNNVQKVVEKTLSEPVDVKSINLLLLTAMYHFHKDDEVLAWRTIGLAARQCFELGLHRRESYDSFTDPDERSAAIRAFWVTYVLDRRWSFGTGMPFAMQDADLDINLPKPDDSTPYLNAMISYSIIGSKVWRSVGNADSLQAPINHEDISFLDFQVLNWHRLIPESMRFVHPESGRQVDLHIPRAVLRHQVVLYLRANQMRILIYRPVLHTATSITENLEFAKIVVKVAKDTIRTLTYINQTTDIYKAQQSMFNYFLTSALAVLFLAVAHAPTNFSTECRDEFYQALDLVRSFSSDSYVSKRLWKTIKMLKEVGPKLGLNLRNDAPDAHSSAAVAMAGLAGHQVDEMAIFSNGQNGNIDTPHGMASDLSNLFDAAGSYPMMQNGYGLSSAEVTNGEFNSVFENDELARIMRDLF
ncbi:hypothetical protein BU23DRAFT_534183 [Bimuria novae-zelandiae CBS 107.79]|uniref:Zn(2)-C6 fungal-type domain-containing protein n=1 Tax=Bimuria novae-zelandiae CBS 107.79 TaxID=1447943 RepID=A0A6A5V872_9PLEO|nr:hypothetical protein BU23DRAFT_534183 [Bimuria novae-zelandiae CBS 107.79]